MKSLVLTFNPYKTGWDPSDPGQYSKVETTQIYREEVKEYLAQQKISVPKVTAKWQGKNLRVVVTLPRDVEVNTVEFSKKCLKGLGEKPEIELLEQEQLYEQYLAGVSSINEVGYHAVTGAAKGAAAGFVAGGIPGAAAGAAIGGGHFGRRRDREVAALKREKEREKRRKERQMEAERRKREIEKRRKEAARKREQAKRKLKK